MNLRMRSLAKALLWIMFVLAFYRSAMAAPPDPAIHWTADWIWPSTSATATHKNQTVLFRKTFTLSSVPSQARLALLADSRYRLYINGAYTGQGPARSPHGWYYYDAFDVASKLRPGRNVIAVEVLWYGQGRAWYVMPTNSGPRSAQAHGALLCQLEMGQGAGQQIIRSDASWKATEDHAWDWNTPELNDLGNVEVYHSDRVAKGWTEPQFDDSSWISASPISSFEGMSSPPEAPYIHIVPRPLAYPVEREIMPAKVVGTGVFPAQVQGAFFFRRLSPLAGLGKSIANEKHQPQASILHNGDALTNPTASGYAEIDPGASGQTPYVILDMGKEVDGYLQFNIDAQKPTAINIGWSEMMVHGDIAADQPGGNFVAQYFVAPGSQHWTMWGWHGLRFVELSFPDLSAPLRFRVGFRFSTAKLDHVGSFTSSSPLLTKLWQMGAYTWQLCTLDGTMDCPTREQHQWLGDGEIELRVNGVADGNPDIAQKFLLDASRDQWRDGAIPMVSDMGGNSRMLIDSYVFSFINALQEHYLETGDKNFVLRLYPSVARSMMWFQGFRQTDGLLGPVPFWNFLDWSNPDAKGESSILNALYAHTLDNAAQLAELAGDRYHAKIFRADSEAVHATFNKHFWDEARGLYVDAWDAGRKSERVGQLANADAILYGFAAADRIPGILAKITDPARLNTGDSAAPMPGENSNKPAAAGQTIIQAQTYGMFFVLEALAAQGKADAVRGAIERFWGPMVAQGNGTFWENFNTQGTLCHAWSAAPTYFITTLILGVKPTKPGYSVYEVAPHPADLEWAKGAVPTVHGLITVDWKWTAPGSGGKNGGSRFLLRLHNPEGETGQIKLPEHNGKAASSVSLNGKTVSGPLSVKSPGDYTVQAEY
ncbi:MAG TPA: family 78 glycoside hydrolase catalytic domain [Terriglobia bacterium]|nr:family 78 glycoside hydrolase catalytic domain [Terriglobia bacterium]